MRHLTVLFAALALTGTAAAATRWTAPGTEAMLTGHATVYAVGLAPRQFTSAHCKRVGQASAGAFRCAVTWPAPNDPTVNGSAILLVRPWSSSAVCVTNLALGSCPPPMPARHLKGDPRACGPNQAQCVNDAATAAWTKGAATPKAVCKASGQWTGYLCRWGTAVGTVTFKAGKTAWSAVTTA